MASPELKRNIVRELAAVSACLLLIAALTYCVNDVYKRHWDSQAQIEILSDINGGDVKDEIEHDSASHLLIKNDVRLAVKLSSEAEKIYIETDSLKAREKKALQSALALKRTGVEKMDMAHQLEQKSQSLITKSQKLQDEFNKQENWAVKEQKLSQEASKDYRHDVLRLAKDVSKISQLRALGKSIPKVLTLAVKNITRQMAVDQTKSKAGYSDLSKRVESRSLSLAGASGKNALALAVPATSWSLDQQSKKESKRAEKIISTANTQIAHIETKLASLNKPFQESECLEK